MEIDIKKRDANRINQRIKWAKEEAALIEQSKQKMAREHGVERGSKFDKCWHIAWEHGHAYGINEVENLFSELVELIK